MNEISEDHLSKVASTHKVSEAELQALRLALAGQTAEASAKTLGISAAAIRKRLSSAYKKFGIPGDVPGKLEVLRSRLLNQYRSSQPTPAPSTLNLEEVPKVSDFVGRAAELQTLIGWITRDDHSRLITVLGMGCIGKTTLTAKLVEQLQDQFEGILWRSLRNAPLLRDVLSDLLQNLSERTETHLSSDIEGQISQLVNFLRQHRYLLVLDNVEAILQQGVLVGSYKAGYEDYGELLTRVGGSFHQSCLILTSREKPKEAALLEAAESTVRSLKLEGLQDIEAQKLLQDRGLSIGEHELDKCRRLIQSYGGNPLALKIVSTTIKENFGGSISDFLGQEAGAFFLGDIRSLLDQQFERLSILEADVMYWLTINLEPISISELPGDLVFPVSMEDLLEVIESLKRRSLIVTERGAFFTLQPVVMEYMIDKLVDCICQEIRAEKVDFFNRYAIIKAEAKDYIEDLQIRFILQPLLNKLLTIFGGEVGVENQLKRILDTLPKEHPPKPGYAGGNVANLICQLKQSIPHEYDFSRIAVWQGDFRFVNLHGVNFTDANLAKSVFSETVSSILSVVFSPNGQQLATGDADGEVRLWHIDRGKYALAWRGKHTSWVRSVAFSPDGKLLASCGGDQTIRLWDAHSGNCLRMLDAGLRHPVRSVVFSADGTLLASGGDDCHVRLWDVSTGQCLKTLEGHNNWIWSVAFSPDGVMLASGGEDRVVRLWDVRTGQCINALQGHENWISSVAFSPDGITLASGSGDCRIRLWDVRASKCLRVLGEDIAEPHTNWVWSVVFNNDGNILASSGDDHTIKLWEVKNGKCSATLRGHTNRVGTIAYSATSLAMGSAGGILVSGSEDQTVRIWDVHTRKCLKTLKGYTNRIGTLAFSPYGLMLASGSDDRLVRVWDVRTGTCTATLRGHTNRVGTITFNPDGKYLASGSDDCTIRVWDVRTWQCIKVLEKHTNWVSSVAFSSDETLIASGSDDCTIRVWDRQTWECIHILKGGMSRLRSIAFSPDRKYLASGSDDKTVQLWDLQTWECIKTLEDDNWVWSIAFSPDSRILASGNEDCTIRLWYVNSDEYKVLKGHTGPLRSVAFSPTGRILASGSGDNTIRLWDAQTGQCLKVLEGHTNWVMSLTFSPDGETLASGSNDGIIMLWHVEKGRWINQLISEKPYQNMNIADTTGITMPQKASLEALGAVEIRHK